MSRNNPIPERLRTQFFCFMDSYADVAEDLPDGAWFATLEEGARKFIKKNNLKFADDNSAVHQYLRHINELAAQQKG
jgi:hypothetical protein